VFGGLVNGDKDGDPAGNGGCAARQEPDERANVFALDGGSMVA
jgi:hypothetical protein